MFAILYCMRCSHNSPGCTHLHFDTSCSFLMERNIAQNQTHTKGCKATKAEENRHKQRVNFELCLSFDNNNNNNNNDNNNQ